MIVEKICDRCIEGKVDQKYCEGCELQKGIDLLMQQQYDKGYEAGKKEGKKELYNAALSKEKYGLDVSPLRTYVGTIELRECMEN